MHYFGGKQRIADEICSVIRLLRGDRPYLEPFLGGANIITRLSGGRRVASDVVPDLIELYRELQNGWVPPRDFSKAEYDIIRASTGSSALRGFAAFGCSFAGKYFGGYAGQDKRTTVSYASNAANGLEKKRPGLMNVELSCVSYDTHQPTGYLIYCDPPYANTTAYAGAPPFDSARFWAMCRWWAANDNIVLVSEYEAPSDIPVCWEKQVQTEIRGKLGRIDRTEKLFLLMPKGAL